MSYTRGGSDSDLHKVIEDMGAKIANNLLDQVDGYARAIDTPDRSSLERISGNRAEVREGWEREVFDFGARSWDEPMRKLMQPAVVKETADLLIAHATGDQAMLREIMDRSWNRALSTTTGGVGTVNSGLLHQVMLLSERVSKMRQLVTVVSGSEASLKVPKVTTTPVPAAHAEAGDMTSGTTDPVIGSDLLVPIKLGQVLSLSRELLEDSPLQITNLIGQLIAEALGNLEDSVIIKGSGGGVDVTENLADDATNSSDTFDDDAETLTTLASKLYELPLDAINNATWLINTDAAEDLAALSGNERQVMTPFDEAPRMLGAAEGGFGMLLGKRVVVFPTSHVAVNTAFCGDLSAYTLWDREFLKIELDRGAAFDTDEFKLHVSRRLDGTISQPTRIRHHPAS